MSIYLSKFTQYTNYISYSMQIKNFTNPAMYWIVFYVVPKVKIHWDKVCIGNVNRSHKMWPRLPIHLLLNSLFQYSVITFAWCTVTLFIVTTAYYLRLSLMECCPEDYLHHVEVNLNSVHSLSVNNNYEPKYFPTDNSVHRTLNLKRFIKDAS